MNIKPILFLFLMIVSSHAKKKNGNGTRNRKSRYLLVELKEKSGNNKAASDSLFLPENSPKLSWLTSSVLEIKIGEKRNKILLKPTTNIPQLNTPCLFNGKVEGDPLSKVFVSGCHNSPETLASIASSQLPDGILDLSLVNGITTSITDDDAERTGSLDYSSEDMANDVFTPPPLRTRTRTAYFSGLLPSKVILKTDIKYDNSLLQHFNNSHEKTKDWINKVIGHTQTRLHLESIRMKVDIEVGTVGHIKKSIEANKKDIYRLMRKKQPELTSYFCEDLGLGTLGVAFRSSACRRDGYAVNIVELYSRKSVNDIKSAKTYAHELGHNLGMQHDFHKTHGGKGCNGKGLMSYGKTLDSWSTCSNSDFIKYWRTDGHTCLVGADPVTTTPAPLEIRTCVNKQDGAPCQVCLAKIWYCGGTCINEICQGNKEKSGK